MVEMKNGNLYRLLRNSIREWIDLYYLRKTAGEIKEFILGGGFYSEKVLEDPSRFKNMEYYDLIDSVEGDLNSFLGQIRLDNSQESYEKIIKVFESKGFTNRGYRAVYLDPVEIMLEWDDEEKCWSLTQANVDLPGDSEAGKNTSFYCLYKDKDGHGNSIRVVFKNQMPLEDKMRLYEHLQDLSGVNEDEYPSIIPEQIKLPVQGVRSMEKIWTLVEIAWTHEQPTTDMDINEIKRNILALAERKTTNVE